MKVIQSFQDYYDGVLSMFALEQTPLYIRKTEPVDSKTNDDLRDKLKFPRTSLMVTLSKKECDKYNIPYHYNHIGLDVVIIGFCGKIYPIYVLWEHTLIRHKQEPLKINGVFHSKEEVKSSFKNINAWYQNKSDSFNDIEEFTKNKTWQKVFVKLDTPIFICYRNNGFVKNPQLNKYNMQKLIHPYTAVQELEMFLNNQLCKNTTPDMPVGSDKIIAESKGYDKYSFKNLPGKKKRSKK